MNNFKKILFILMLGLISKTQAQVISELTEKTTDVLKEGETKSFNWLTYKPTTIYNARPETGTCYSGSGVYLPDENTICFYRIECNKLVSLTCRTVSVKIAPFTIGGGSTNGGSLNNNNSGTSGNIGTGSNSTLLGGGSFNISYNDGQISWLNNPFSNLALSGNLGNPWNFNDPTGGGSIIKANNNPSNPNQTNGPDKGNTNPCFKIGGIKSFKDSCGNCVGGTTPWKPCAKDCDNKWGGTAAKDSCGKCTGGTTLKIACNKIPCQTDSTMKVTSNLLYQIAPKKTFKTKTDSTNYKFVMDSFPKYINQYMADFGITNRDALSSFLAIAAQETNNFIELEEDHNYSKEAIRDNFADALFPDTIINKYVRCLCVFDRAYAEDCDKIKHTNCNEASKDGSKYRGRGLFHLTHKDSYWRFTKYYQQKYKDYTVDFEANPELIASKAKFAVLSALWELAIDKSQVNGVDKKEVVNPIKQAQKGNFESVMNAINRYDSNKKDKRKKLEIAKKQLCL